MFTGLLYGIYTYSERPLILADRRFIDRCGHNDVSDVTVCLITGHVPEGRRRSTRRRMHRRSAVKFKLYARLKYEARWSAPKRQSSAVVDAAAAAAAGGD